MMLATGSLRRLAAFVCAAVSVLAAGLAAAQPAAAPRPNIVMIVTDDMGWKDVGFRGSDIATPNIDRLAAGGARLEQFYVQPMCTPTRAAMMTGRYPFRYGLQTGVIPSGHNYGLALDERLLPQVLGEAGYKTAIVGKWHLGHADRRYWPRQRGFDYHYGLLIGEVDYFKHTGHGVRDWFRDNEPLVEEGYVTQLLGDDAIRVLARHGNANPGPAKQPLFLYLPFTAPHAPFQAPQPYLDRYKGIADANRRAYAAMITALDEQIGRVVDEIDRRGMRDNTLILLINDNGGPREAAMAGEGTASGDMPQDNSPYRDGKNSLYEGGTRVLAIANWPGRIPAGSVVEQPMHAVDLLPTLAGLAGAPIKPAKPLDGVDVWPAIAGGKPSARNEVVYNLEVYRAAIRQGDWKLVWNVLLPSKVELFDLAKDPAEKTNLADKHPDKVREMQRRIEELSAQAAPSLLLQTEMGAAMRRIGTTPPQFPKSGN